MEGTFIITKCYGLEKGAPFFLSPHLFSREEVETVMRAEREKRKKWGNKPGKFIFPRGLPFKFRPSKNGTPNGNRSHNDVQLSGADRTGLRQTVLPNKNEMSDNNWKLI